MYFWMYVLLSLNTVRVECFFSLFVLLCVVAYQTIRRSQCMFVIITDS